MKERANTFNDVNNKINGNKSYHTNSNIKILGFRLLEVKQNVEEIEL